MFRKRYAGEDVELWRKGMKLYERHLRRKRPRIPRDLWRYFSIDWFHDGLMSVALPDLADRRLELSITCPNVQRRTSKGWVYTSLDFECTFLGVEYLRVHVGNEWPARDPLRRYDCQFLYAEIDTISAKEVGFTRHRPFHSLVIQVNDGWIEFTFTTCRVRPVNERLYKRMLQNRGRFYIPFTRKAPAWADDRNEVVYQDSDDL